MPLVSQRPPECLPIALFVRIISAKVKPVLLSVLVQVLNVKINLVCELVPRYLATLIPKVTIRIHPNNDLAHFSAIGFHISHDLRLVIHSLTPYLPTDSVDFCNFWYNFLKSCIDFSELLLPLLLIQLGTHRFIHILFVTLAFCFQDLLLFLDLSFKSSPFFSNLSLHLQISFRLHLSLRRFELSNMSRFLLLKTCHLLLE